MSTATATVKDRSPAPLVLPPGPPASPEIAGLHALVRGHGHKAVATLCRMLVELDSELQNVGSLVATAKTPMDLSAVIRRVRHYGDRRAKLVARIGIVAGLCGSKLPPIPPPPRALADTGALLRACFGEMGDQPTFLREQLRSQLAAAVSRREHIEAAVDDIVGGLSAGGEQTSESVEHQLDRVAEFHAEMCELDDWIGRTRTALGAFEEKRGTAVARMLGDRVEAVVAAIVAALKYARRWLEVDPRHGELEQLRRQFDGLVTDLGRVPAGTELARSLASRKDQVELSIRELSLKIDKDRTTQTVTTVKRAVAGDEKSLGEIEALAKSVSDAFPADFAASLAACRPEVDLASTCMHLSAEAQDRESRQHRRHQAQVFLNKLSPSAWHGLRDVLARGITGNDAARGDLAALGFRHGGFDSARYPTSGAHGVAMLHQVEALFDAVS